MYLRDRIIVFVLLVLAICALLRVNQIARPVIAQESCSATPTPTPDSGAGSCVDNTPEDGNDFENCIANTNSTWLGYPDCRCSQWLSPVLVDILGNGFNLTDAAGGVFFDLDSNGIREKLSWTSIGSDDAWLALDRNGNDLIENGTELFGNYTPQPEPPPGEQKNGFLGLAVFDKTNAGGNNDGVIDSHDTVFSFLRFWQDSNHNGLSESNELRAVRELGLKSLHLDYKTSKRTDEFGNRFRYRAKVRDTNGFQLGRWAWDVFLISPP